MANEDGAPTGSANTGNADGGNNQPETFTQDQVNSMIKEATSVAVHSAISDRMARESATRDKKISSASEAAVAEFRERYGLDDERLTKLEGADVATAELSRSRLELQAKERELEAANSAAESERTKRHGMLKRLEIEKAARSGNAHEGAISQITDLLGARIAVAEDGSLEVLGDDGTPTHGASVAEFVADFLKANDHFVAPSTTGGGGGRPRVGNGAPAGTVDMSTPDGIAAYYSQATSRKS